MNREIGPFFCKELLPAHLEGALDPSRRQAVEAVLEQNQEVRQTFESMQERIQFLEELGKIEADEHVVAYVHSPPSQLRDRVKKYAWSNWSENARWSAQLAMVAFAVMITVRYVPWFNLARTLQSVKPTAPVLKPVVAVEDTMEVLKPKPMYGPEWPKNLPSPEQYAKQREEAQKRNQDIADRVAKSDEELTEHSGTDADDSITEAAPQQGYVWRGVVKVDELTDEISQQVVDTIVRLGGKKAGQVELGWKKGTSRYFHFTIPESNYTEFNQSLQELGQISLKKEKHPRVMGAGTMRVIMSLESGH